MPSVRAFLRGSGAFSAALLRLVRTVVVAGFAAFALALLVLRFAVFPQVETFRGTLAAALSRQLGHPVEITALTPGWDGWNPKLVVHGLRVQDPLRAGTTPLLELPEVEMIVAWTSLPLFELRFKELVIDRPRLAVRRGRDGMVRIAGIEIDPAEVRDDTPISDWILRQHQIVVRDALITWDDDQRNAPQLVLDRVQFRLENRFGRHRFGLRGTPPADMAAPLDLRGDLANVSSSDWAHAEGKMFVRLDYADVAAWREWLPLPPQIVGGKGALRIWFDFGQGEAREVVADLELADVKAKLEQDLPALDVAHVSGRAGWRIRGAEREVFARDLAFTTLSGDRLDPTNFTLIVREPTGERPSSGQLEFDRLQLEPLVALGAHLPFSVRVRSDLARYAPRGELTRGRMRWEGTTDAPSAYSATAEFTRLGFAARDGIPGVTGLAGRVNLSQDRGEIKVSSNDAVLELPRVFDDPLSLDSLQTVLKWERRDGKTSVRIEQLEFANADATVTASGTFRTSGHGPGEIDLVAHASRIEAEHVHRYIPRSIDQETRNWLRTSLTAGFASDARLKVAGNVADFPFAKGKGGHFMLTTKAKGVTLAFAEGWPPIEAIDGDVRIDGSRLRIDAARGRATGVDIGKTRAEIEDLALDHPLLKIDGDAAGPLSGFIRYVNESPVTGWIDRLTDGAETAGNAQLGLSLAIPLGRVVDTRVAGDLTVADAQARLAGIPALSKVSGKLAFTERELRARDVALEMLGGPAKLSVTSGDGSTRIAASGTLTLAALQREYPNRYLDRVSGTLDWSLGGNMRPEGSSWSVESPLKGATIDLPPPLGKSAGEAMPLRFEQRDDPAHPGSDTVTGSYGRVAQFAVHRQRAAAGGAAIDRALLSLGRAIDRPDARSAERPGWWIRAELPALDLDEWITVARRESAAATERNESLPGLAGADLDVGTLDALGLRFADLKVGAREGASGWSIDLNGKEVAGNATWASPDSGAPNGRIVARLSRISVPSRSAAAVQRGSEKETNSDAKADAASSWPEIDVAADSLLSKERDLGRLELVAHPRGAEWRIDRLVVANDSGRLEAEGAWRALGREQQTKLDIILDTKETGAFLATFGYPGAVQGAPTKIDGQLAWSGAPHEFDFPTLAGSFHVATGPGRFTKIEPGPGKLLGVLSLQALPRRATLDFRDVFSDGFAFDEIAGNVRIANGVMTTNNLKLLGPAAKVDIAGDADLAKETQRLSVRVQPALSSSVSAGAALFFIANPLVGAAVGAGSLLAQTMLKDPIEKMFTYEYTVTGNWSDPVVSRGAAAPASFPQTTAQPSAGSLR